MARTSYTFNEMMMILVNTLESTSFNGF